LEIALESLNSICKTRGFDEYGDAKRWDEQTSFKPAVVKQSTPNMKEVAPTKAVEMRRAW